MQISVVIPTYRRPHMLFKCLQALVAQEFDREQYEIIIVSDGPDELTKRMFDKLIEQKLEHMSYHHLPEKKGPAAARNYGWLLAQGKLVAFTDDDCIPQKFWLQSFWNAYKPACNIAFTGKTIVPIAAKPTDYELNISHLQTADFITANCCCSKTALQITGGFDEDFKMAWREDSDLEFKFLQKNIPIVKVEDAVVIHPVRKAKWGVSIKEQKKTMFNVLLYKKYPKLYRQKIQSRPPLNYYATIIAFVIMLLGVALSAGFLFIPGAIVWLGLTISFITKRLKNTSIAPDHVLEMTVTSFVIPFLSIYWQMYGMFKYKAILI